MAQGCLLLSHLGWLGGRVPSCRGIAGAAKCKALMAAYGCLVCTRDYRICFCKFLVCDQNRIVVGCRCGLQGFIAPWWRIGARHDRFASGSTRLRVRHVLLGKVASGYVATCACRKLYILNGNLSCGKGEDSSCSADVAQLLQRVSQSFKVD